MIEAATPRAAPYIEGFGSVIPPGKGSVGKQPRLTNNATLVRKILLVSFKSVRNMKTE